MFGRREKEQKETQATHTETGHTDMRQGLLNCMNSEIRGNRVGGRFKA
jgi:hypothetical protein